MPSGENWQRTLVDEIRKNGYKVARTGNGSHQKVLTKSGQVVTDDNGPLIISGTAGDRRAREMHVQRFMAKGVLKRDPWKETREGDTEGRPEKKTKDEQAEARRLQALRERSEALRQQTMTLRSRFEPIVAKLGGWGTRTSVGTVTSLELAEVCWSWALRNQRDELPAVTTRGEPTTLEHMKQAVTRLKNPSETVPERWLPMLKVFVDELEREAGSPADPSAAANRYRALLRESRQLPTPDDFEDDTFEEGEKTIHDRLRDVMATHAATNGGGNGDREYARVGPMYEAEGLPLVAMEVLYRIDPAGTDYDTAMRLAMQVARLERVASPPTTTQETQRERSEV